MDIEDSVLVAVANYNGYFVYKINSNNGIITELEEKIHISKEEMDNSLGDNRAQSVIISKKNNLAFIMDQFDHIWLYKYQEDAIQFGPPNYLEEDCFGGTWLSIALDDRQDRIGVYTLLKHNAAEFLPYCIHNNDLSSLGTDQGCSDIDSFIASQYSDQTSCQSQEGYSWMYPGCQVGNYAEYSTSLVWRNIQNISSTNTSIEGDPDCEYIINQDAIAEKIYFDNGLLVMSNGELGVKVFKQTQTDICLTDSGLVSLIDAGLCSEHKLLNSTEIDYKSCCESPVCAGGIGQCPWYDKEGYGGKFSTENGIIPSVYVDFDVPGEVEAVFSYNNTIIAGLKYSNGCLIKDLDENGMIIGSSQIAKGYSINGIHIDNDLLVLAAGHDGLLLYIRSDNEFSFIGKIETSYANNVKVHNNIIYAATEDGVEIIQIEL